MNKVILMGRLTEDPKLRFAANNGQAIAAFTLAVNNPYKANAADFINCIAWGKNAENIAKYVFKGQQLLIEGSWRNEVYEKDGEKKYTSRCHLSRFDFIGNKAQNNTPANGPQGNFEDYSNYYDDPNSDMTQVEDGEVPF